MNWYRLAICEDDPGERRVLEGLCQEILAGRKIPAQITVFPHTGLLAEALGKDSQAFDRLLLDIQMEEKTGMELAKDLRAQGNQVRILFVTGAPQYALEGYQVGPIHYLLSPWSGRPWSGSLSPTGKSTTRTRPSCSGPGQSWCPWRWRTSPLWRA